jgi:hypothetical protein
MIGNSIRRCARFGASRLAGRIVFQSTDGRSAGEFRRCGGCDEQQQARLQCEVEIVTNRRDDDRRRTQVRNRPEAGRETAVLRAMGGWRVRLSFGRRRISCLGTDLKNRTGSVTGRQSREKPACHEQVSEQDRDELPGESRRSHTQTHRRPAFPARGTCGRSVPPPGNRQKGQKIKCFTALRWCDRH